MCQTRARLSTNRGASQCNVITLGFKAFRFEQTHGLRRLYVYRRDHRPRQPHWLWRRSCATHVALICRPCAARVPRISRSYAAHVPPLMCLSHAFRMPVANRARAARMWLVCCLHVATLMQSFTCRRSGAAACVPLLACRSHATHPVMLLMCGACALPMCHSGMGRSGMI